MAEITGELGYAARILMLGCGNSGLSEVVRSLSLFDLYRRVDEVDVRCGIQEYSQSGRRLSSVDFVLSLERGRTEG